jgi:SAM-dependent methyltransferase
VDQKTLSYGSLCSFYYDATEGFAPESEVAFFAAFIDKHKNGRVLEAMSGSGRLQIPLLQRGYCVDGVDRSPTMLARCRERCIDLGLKPELYEQALEELALPHTYSTIIIALGSFQLIIERENAVKSLKALHKHMNANGDLLIDIFVPDQTNKALSSSCVRINEHIEIKQATRYIFQEAARRAQAFCLYELIVDGIVAQQENELIEVTWYTDEELTQLLNEAGFEVVDFYERSFRSAGPSRIVHAYSRGL